MVAHAFVQWRPPRVVPPSACLTIRSGVHACTQTHIGQTAASDWTAAGTRARSHSQNAVHACLLVHVCRSQYTGHHADWCVHLGGVCACMFAKATPKRKGRHSPQSSMPKRNSPKSVPAAMVRPVGKGSVARTRSTGRQGVRAAGEHAQQRQAETDSPSTCTLNPAMLRCARQWLSISRAISFCLSVHPIFLHI